MNPKVNGYLRIEHRSEGRRARRYTPAMVPLAARYLELLKKSLLDELYIENEARLVYLILTIAGQSVAEEETIRDIATERPDIVQRLREWRREGRISFVWDVSQPDGSVMRTNFRNVMEFYHTMIGRKRLDNIQQLMEQVIADGIPGDVIETGVWRGGVVILMRAILEAYGDPDRAVYAADSFQGLPPPDLSAYPADAGSRLHDAEPLVVARSEVERNFRLYGLLDERVRFLEGWFADTLPTVADRTWSVVRLDGDMYGSTIDALENLYPRLSVGGFLIVDDYGFDPCRQAVTDYRDAHGIDDPIESIDWLGAFWRRAH